MSFPCLISGVIEPRGGVLRAVQAFSSNPRKRQCQIGLRLGRWEGGSGKGTMPVARAEHACEDASVAPDAAGSGQWKGGRGHRVPRSRPRERERTKKNKERTVFMPVPGFQTHENWSCLR